MALQVLLDYAAETGEYEPVLEALDSLYPHLFDEPPHDLDKSYMATYLAGIALTRSGEVERGTELLQWWQDESNSIEEVYGTSRASVTVTLMLGDENDALGRLDRFSKRKDGWVFHRALLEHDSSFDPIRDEPQFVALLDDYRANAEKQRQLLQAMNAD